MSAEAGLCACLRAAARNSRCANHRLHKACIVLRQGEFTATRTGFLPSIAATLNHIRAIDPWCLDAPEGGGIDHVKMSVEALPEAGFVRPDFNGPVSAPLGPT